MKHLLWILAALLLVGCASRRDVTRHSETIYKYQDRQDSVFKALFLRDSIYVHDSIYVRDKGDTVYQYVEKLRYQYKDRVDTIYKNVLRCDTVYIERTDTTTVIKEVRVVKPVKWYNQGFVCLGRMCCIAVIMWLIFLYLKRKF